MCHIAKWGVMWLSGWNACYSAGTSVPVRFLKDNKEVIPYFITLTVMSPTKIHVKAAENMQKMYEFMTKNGKTTLFSKYVPYCYFPRLSKNSESKKEHFTSFIAKDMNNTDKLI
jgi:hypothetical protein